MKLSGHAIISSEKLTRYLLVKRPVGDKSAFLKQAGYIVGNWKQLEHDLRRQILTKDAVSIEKTVYGEIFEIRASLVGPNGMAIRLITIWMREAESGLTKFITLYPDKGGDR